MRHGQPRGQGVGEHTAEGTARVAPSSIGLRWRPLRHCPRDMSLASLSTLCLIEATGPRRVTDLVVLDGVAQPSMTAVVRSLEAAGLVERRRDPCDGRAVLVEISDMGRAEVC